ncbi:hypothetical protein CI102_9703 [Trichoderma harzianum]|nr:hypothetical protein CI102_9703 [Trichoderma harzianum]
MQNLTPLEEARARRFQRASSHHHIDYMHSYTLLNSVTPLALVALNTSRSSIGFKHGSYSVWAYYQNVSNDQQQATKKLWAPDPLLARAHRSGKASCHSSMPIHCTVVQVALSPALTKLDTNKGPPPASPRATRKTFCCWFRPPTSVLVTGSAAFPNQPSGERMHESSGGLLQAGWNAQLRAKERERRVSVPWPWYRHRNLALGFFGA